MRNLRIVIISLLMPAMTPVLAETYNCTAATNRAKVGSSRSNEVGITSDSGKKECRFSINGAPVGSPPQSAVVAGLNALITGDAVTMMTKGDLEPIANLLISSSEEKSPSPALLGILREHASELAKCFSTFKGAVAGPLLSKGVIFCGGVKAGPVPIAESPVELHDTQGMHVLAVSPSKGLVHFVFFPANFRRGEPIPMAR